MDQTAPKFYSWPGGSRSVAGGTRTGIKLSRPWQKPIDFSQGKCPFCGGPSDREKKFFPENGGWYFFNNHYTPYSFHKLIVPEKCLPEDELRFLGGKEKIKTALSIAIEEMRENWLPLFLTVHVGYLAGQNVPHLHYHLVRYISEERNSTGRDEWHAVFESRRDLVLYDSAHMLIGVGGLRAGQCFILPKPDLENSNFELSEILSDHLNNLISLYNLKFGSNEGLYPDFALTLYFNKGFQYGTYVPYLNNWGSSEHLALYENCELALPWPHEQTVEHLKS